MQHYITVAILGMKKNAMPEAEPAPKYSPDSDSSYATGYWVGKQGSKSYYHDKRMLETSKYDKGYAKGWKEYTHITLINILKGKV